jgi:hypothetical protein
MWMLQGSRVWSQWGVVHRSYVLLACRKFGFYDVHSASKLGTYLQHVCLVKNMLKGGTHILCSTFIVPSNGQGFYSGRAAAFWKMIRDPETIDLDDVHLLIYGRHYEPVLQKIDKKRDRQLANWGVRQHHCAVRKRVDFACRQHENRVPMHHTST